MSELIKRDDVQREIQASFDGGAFRWQDGQDLMDRINAIPAALRWHRVEDVLPDDSRDVIIFTASGIVGIGSFIRPNWYQWYSGGGLPVDVTHWMEKPEPPQEVQDGKC